MTGKHLSGLIIELRTMYQWHLYDHCHWW